MATRTGNVLWLRPSFFLAQPGRRYFSESQRRTPLQLGYDVPLLLEADSSARRSAGDRFGSERHYHGRRGALLGGTSGPGRDASGDAPGTVHLLLRRRWQLPLSRVSPKQYDELASELRQVDPLEQGEIRVELPPGTGK